MAVIGAGMAGLSAAYALVRSRPDLEVVVLEAGARVGGLVHTELTPDGCLLERGPDAMMAGRAEVDTLTHALGLETLAPSRALGSRVVIDGARHPLPMGVLVPGLGSVGGVMGSGLLPWSGRARLAVEGFVPARRSPEDETVEDFVARRMGRAVLDRMIRPLLHGIRGADPAEMSAHATLPQLVAMERTHGSLTAAMLREAWSRRGGRKGPGGARRPGGMVSFGEGMAALPGAMAEVLGERVRLGCAVRSVSREAGGVTLRLGDGSRVEVDRVVMAVPAYGSAGLLEGFDAEASDEAGAVKYVPAVHLTLGFDEAGVGPVGELPGLVVAASEGLSVRACTWSSRKFPGRAPRGTVTVRCSLMPEALEADDAALVETVRSDLRTLTGLEAVPRWSRVVKIARAIPQFAPGHGARVARVSEPLAETGVVLAGAAWGGAGVAECVAGGVAAAGRALGAAA